MLFKNLRVCDNELATYIDEMLSINSNKGVIEFYSRDAVDNAMDYLISLGYKLQYTFDNDTHYIKYVKKS